MYIYNNDNNTKIKIQTTPCANGLLGMGWAKLLFEGWGSIPRWKMEWGSWLYKVLEEYRVLENEKNRPLDTRVLARPIFFFSSIYSFWHSSTRTSRKKSRVLGRVLFFFPPTFFTRSSTRVPERVNWREKKMGRASTRVSSGLFFSFSSTRYSSSTLYNHGGCSYPNSGELRPSPPESARVRLRSVSGPPELRRTWDGLGRSLPESVSGPSQVRLNSGGSWWNFFWRTPADYELWM